MSSKLARRFPPRWRAISWQRLNASAFHINREIALFRVYKARFGELPPMNEQSGV